MHTRLINTEEAPNKRYAALDRRMRNIVNSSHYTLAERTRAQRMQLALELCYAGVVYEPSYGTTGVSIKVVGFVSRKRDLAALESEWAAAGVIKKVSPQGTIYRFKK